MALTRGNDALTANELVALQIDLQLKPSITPEMFGALGDGATDDTTAFNSAVTSAATLGVPLSLGPKTYYLAAGLSVNGRWAAIQGSGAEKTTLKIGAASNGLSIGPGVAGSGSKPSGFLRDLTVLGASAAPSNGSIGVLLNGARQFRVQNVEVSNFDIGFDAINNCFGSVWENIRAGFFANCNVGINLRTGPQSGNDLVFINPWVNGKVAGVHISPSSADMRFYGGQISGQPAADNDLLGAVILGKDYLTGTVGGVGPVNFDGVDFESVMRAWVFRAYGQISLSVHACSILANNATAPALGLLKMEAALQSQVSFTGNMVSGAYAAAALASIASAGSAMSVFESATLFNGPLTANGVNIAGAPMSIFNQSAITLGSYFFRTATNPIHSLGGAWLRNNAGKLEISTNSGGAWTVVGTQT